jgi:hypothetical protein
MSSDQGSRLTLVVQHDERRSGDVARLLANAGSFLISAALYRESGPNFNEATWIVRVSEQARYEMASGSVFS